MELHTKAIVELAELLDASNREVEKLRIENKELEARCKWLEGMLRVLQPEDWR